MANITFSAEDEVIRKARKIALDKRTTLTALLRDYLVSLAKRSDTDRSLSAEAVARTFERFSRHIGERTWTRETLHER